MKRPKITKEQFRNWLVERQTAVVGLPANSLSCPIAQYLTDFGQNQSVNVQVGREKIQINGRHYAEPRWIRDFVETVDLWRWESAAKRTKIRGAVALRILDTGRWRKV